MDFHEENLVQSQVAGKKTLLIKYKDSRRYLEGLSAKPKFADDNLKKRLWCVYFLV